MSDDFRGAGGEKLECCVYQMKLSVVLIQYTRVTDGRTGRQTDQQTDGRKWRSIYRAQHSVAR